MAADEGCSHCFLGPLNSMSVLSASSLSSFIRFRSWGGKLHFFFLGEGIFCFLNLLPGSIYFCVFQTDKYIVGCRACCADLSTESVCDKVSTAMAFPLYARYDARFH